MFWFTQVGSMRCGDCQSRPYHVVFRPEPTAMWTQNWCEASGCGNGVGWTPKPKAFWRSPVVPWWSAWRCEREKHRAPFQEQIPCKLQDIIIKALQIPGEFKVYFGEWISSFALAKTTCFFKTFKTLARLSPRREVFASSSCRHLLWQQRISVGCRLSCRRHRNIESFVMFGRLVMFDPIWSKMQCAEIYMFFPQANSMGRKKSC